MNSNIKSDFVAKLDQWGVVPLTVDPYQPPECAAHGLDGFVSSHPKFADGDHITTSAIMKAEHVQNVDIILVTTASGSVYELAEVNPEYERQFPNARERFIRAQCKS